MSEFMHTDLPEPVVPAMSICGSFAILPTTQSPPMSLPSAKLSLDLALMNFGDSMISRRYTVLTILFGTSMPTVDILSGMGAMRTFTTPRASARSPARFVTRASLTPCSSSISKRVTVGPRVTPTIAALMPKLLIAPSRRSLLTMISSRASTLATAPVRSRSTGGNSYPRGVSVRHGDRRLHRLRLFLDLGAADLFLAGRLSRCSWWKNA